jgi:hypothetical protein
MTKITEVTRIYHRYELVRLFRQVSNGRPILSTWCLRIVFACVFGSHDLSLSLTFYRLSGYRTLNPGEVV